MSEVVLDQKTLAKFQGAKKRVAIRDRAGTLWGYFTPVDKKSPRANIEIPFSEAELQRREKEKKTFNTAQVLKFLKNLETR
jgi:hypothetical protein